jgi:hypothetical protein
MPPRIYHNSKPLRPTVCPVCGDDIPKSALACPGCGADERTGWDHRQIEYGALNLPDEDFSYDEFLKREFGSSVKPRNLKWFWWCTGVVLLVLMAMGLVLGR